MAVKIEDDRAFAAIVLPEEQRAFRVWRVLVDGPMERVGLPSGGSTLMTSAPSPASVRPQYSACSSAISMTRMPVSDPGWAAGVLVTAFSAGFPRKSIVILTTAIMARLACANFTVGAASRAGNTAPRHSW